MKTQKNTEEKLFDLLGIHDNLSLKKCSGEIGLSVEKLRYYNDNMIIPTGKDMEYLSQYTKMSGIELELRLGHVSSEVLHWLKQNADKILPEVHKEKQSQHEKLKVITPAFESERGRLYNDDCMDVLCSLPDDSVDMIFADPPFNLNKDYGEGVADNITKSDYLQWSELWIKECIRVLKPGGAMFIYNIPYWNTYLANILNKYLNFRHWIAIAMKGLVPVQGKLQPEHYSLLYYIKGSKPNVFNKQRIPMVTCRHCGGELRDYGGKKKDLNPEGISVADIFMDINPVRHKKYKNREANQLPLRLLERVISLSTNEDDVVLDPFGGSGTTYAAAELMKRNWIGMEIGDTDVIIERIRNNEQDTALLREIRQETNVLFTEDQVKLRQKNHFWTYEKLKTDKKILIE